MKKLLVLLIILFSLTSNVVWSADYNKGVEALDSEDYATALSEWKPLAENGNSSAQYGLGYLYDEGFGVIQDYKTALKWFRLSASNGNDVAQFVMGLKYYEGRSGLIKDYKTAFKWYKLSAEQGYSSAQNSLGRLYLNGHGVLRDNIYSHMWFNISASSGNENAISNRDLVEEKMTFSDISKAQNLARECVAKNYKDC